MNSAHASIRSRKKKALRLIELGRFQEAATLLIEVCRARPGDTDAWRALAEAYCKLRLFLDCAQCCHKVLEHRPRDHRALVLLGRALDVLGRAADAMPILQAAVDTDPNDAEAHHLLGNAAFSCGLRTQAVEAYHAAIALRPDYFEALNNLAAALRADGQAREALPFLERAHGLRPEHPQPLHTLAMVHVALGQHEAALAPAERAVALAPDDADGHRVLANVHYQAARFDAALESFERALAIAPNQPVLVAGKAAILERRGEFDAARAVLAPQLEAGEVAPAVALVFAALAPSLGQADVATALLERQLVQGRLNPGQTVDCHYELGRLADARGDYERAFHHFAVANEKQRRGQMGDLGALDEDSLERLFETTLAHCDRAFWASLCNSGNRSERPVFVLGMPRSGTTLVEQILSSHPAVHGGGELEVLPAIAQQLIEQQGAGEPYPAGLRQVDTAILDRYAGHYLAALEVRNSHAARVVDKLPHNFLHLGLIAALLPCAHVVHTRRDPRDTCLSMFFTKFNARTPYATDLAALGRHYRRYERLMAHWRAVLDLPLLELDYEALVDDQQAQTQRLLEFCGLERDARCLAFERQRRDVDSPSYRQVREPLYSHAVGRWQNYSAYLAPLLEALEET
ncbi:MAG: sulfotransferase [Gammaproteobacteria bacterium]